MKITSQKIKDVLELKKKFHGDPKFCIGDLCKLQVSSQPKMLCHNLYHRQNFFRITKKFCYSLL